MRLSCALLLVSLVFSQIALTQGLKSVSPSRIPTPQGGQDFIIIQVSPHSSSEQLDIAVQSGSVGVWKVELVDYNAYNQWTPFTWNPEGYWSFKSASMLSIPISLRITSKNGNELVLFHIITSYTHNIVNTYMTWGHSSSTVTVDETPVTDAHTESQTSIAPAREERGIETPITGHLEPITFTVHEASNAYWFALQVNNANEELASVDILETGATEFVELKFFPLQDNYWILPPTGSALTAPLVIRATSVTGKTVSAILDSIDQNAVANSHSFFD